MSFDFSISHSPLHACACVCVCVCVCLSFGASFRRVGDWRKERKKGELEKNVKDENVLTKVCLLVCMGAATAPAAAAENIE